jgi:WD40 repeat protein
VTTVAGTRAFTTRNDIYCVAVSPDGSRIAVGGDRRTAMLFDGAGQDVAVLEVAPAYSGAIFSVAFSRDGARVATAGGFGRHEDKEAPSVVRVYDARTGAFQLAVSFQGIGLPYAMGFSPRGDRIAVGGSAGSIAYVSLDERRVASSRPAHAGAVRSLDWAEDGLLASCGDDRRVLTWENQASDPVALECPSTLPIASVRFTPDGRVAAASEDGFVYIQDARARTSMSNFHVHDKIEGLGQALANEAVHGLAFLAGPDGGGPNRIAVVTNAQRVYAFELGAGDPQLLWTAQRPRIWDWGSYILAGCVATDRLYVSPRVHWLQVFDGAGHDKAPPRFFHVTSLDLSPDEKTLLVGGGDGTVHTIGADGKPGTSSARNGMLTGVAFLKGGTQVASTTWSATTESVFEIRERSSGKVAGESRGRDSLRALAAFADGRSVAFAFGHRVMIYREGRKESERPVDGMNDVLAIAPTGRGDDLLIGSDSLVLLPKDGGVTTIEKDRGILGSYYTSAAVSPDGRHAIAGCEDGRLLLVSLPTLEKRVLDEGGAALTRTVAALAFTRDGSLAIAATHDGALRVFDAVSGAEVWKTSLADHADCVSALAPLKDGGFFAGTKRGLILRFERRP